MVPQCMQLYNLVSTILIYGYVVRLGGVAGKVLRERKNRESGVRAMDVVNGSLCSGTQGDGGRVEGIVPRSYLRRATGGVRWLRA